MESQVLTRVQKNFQAERFCFSRSDPKDSFFSFVRPIFEAFLKVREISLDHDVFQQGMLSHGRRTPEEVKG